MPESRLIEDYLADLSAELPALIVAELADGLDQTWRHHLRQGLDPDAAAEAAVAEFGDTRVVVAAFAGASPARLTARRLLATGPVVGMCWGLALVVNRAWTWPVPAALFVLAGVALFTVIGLLAAAALSKSYRSATRAGTAACLGITTLDASMLIAFTLAVPAVTWPVLIAAMASTARIILATYGLRSVMAG